MATYNGAKYIKEQMDSILSQRFKENDNVELEIIVSDDGSTETQYQSLNLIMIPVLRFSIIKIIPSISILK